MADGTQRWRVALDGPVFTPPAYADGRIYVPGGDGWISVLDATDGALVWKRRLAPMERRILLFDQLTSTWPVVSLVVADGVVYASAGMHASDGGVTFAMAADTGEIRWQKQHPVGPDQHLTARQGFAGHMSVIGERIWSAGYRSLPLCLDRQTGADPLVELKEKLRNRRSDNVAVKTLFTSTGGQDVIQLDPGHVLLGGDHLLEEQQMRTAKRGVRSYRLFRLDEQGNWVIGADSPIASIIHTARLAPACDGELLVFAAPPPTATNKHGKQEVVRMVHRSTKGLNVWKLDRFLEIAHASPKQAICEEKDEHIALPLYGRDTIEVLNHDRAAWQLPDLDCSAVALSANAVIAAHATGHETLKYPWSKEPDQRKKNARKPRMRYTGWKLSAFTRADGAELWSVDLPSEPVYNGLAIAADGSVVVTLRSGGMVCVGAL
jgi:hypothetical protein